MIDDWVGHHHSRPHSPLSHVPAALKLGVAIAIIVITVLVPGTRVSWFVGASIFLALVVLISRLPLLFLLKRLALLSPFVLGVALLNALQPVAGASWWNVAVRSAICLLTVILVSHNLALVAEIADRIAVMYGGRIVELASVDEIFAKPLHPYTQGLIACVPNILLEQKELNAMPGSPPDLVGEREYCSFHPRCPHAMDVCRAKTPKLKDCDGREVACWLYERNA